MLDVSALIKIGQSKNIGIKKELKKKAKISLGAFYFLKKENFHFLILKIELKSFNSDAQTLGLLS